MPSIRWLLLIPAIAVLQTACGPIRATTGVVDARAAIRSAEEVQADSVALYEMTLAREYLQKAREEMGYNDYYVAEQLSLKAIELATAAREKAVGVEQLLEDDTVGGPVLEEPDLDVLPDIGELAPDRRAGDEEEGDDLLQPEGGDPWGGTTQPEEAAPPVETSPPADTQPIFPEGVPWGPEPTTPPTTSPTTPPPAQPETGTEGTPPAEAPPEAPPEAPSEDPPGEPEEEEEDDGGLLLPDWLDEEEP